MIQFLISLLESALKFLRSRKHHHNETLVVEVLPPTKPIEINKEGMREAWKRTTAPPFPLLDEPYDTDTQTD